MKNIIVVFRSGIKRKAVFNKLIVFQDQIFINFDLGFIVPEQSGIDKSVVEDRLMQVIVIYDLRDLIHHTAVITRHNILIIADILCCGEDFLPVRLRRHHGIQHADKFGRINGSERFGIKRHLIFHQGEPFLHLGDRRCRLVIGQHWHISGIRTLVKQFDIEIRGKLIERVFSALQHKLAVKRAGNLVIMKGDIEVRILRGFSAEYGKLHGPVADIFGIQNGKREIIDHILCQITVVIHIAAGLIGEQPIVFVIERIIHCGIGLTAVKIYRTGGVGVSLDGVMIGAVDLQLNGAGHPGGRREIGDRLRIEDAGIEVIRTVFKRNGPEGKNRRIVGTGADRKVIFDNFESVRRILGGKRHDERLGAGPGVDLRGVAATGDLFDQLAVFVGAEIVGKHTGRVINLETDRIRAGCDNIGKRIDHPRRKSAVKRRRSFHFAD